ncbi:hypothetical protein MHU86_10019 [Fragilaria crotonensis]|nr:hypothetical protein MHU86_10019 [Fragilaria crotonensis]
MSSTAGRAISGYRRLFRARNKLFQGDIRALAESKIAIRAEFEKNRVVSDPHHLEGLLVMIDEAEDMMLHGIVQGKLNEHGNYEVKVKAEHADSGGPVTTVEPITSSTVDKMSGVKPNVEITKTQKPS